MARKSTDRDYWGIWSNQDYFSGRKDFYEVVHLRYIGLAWEELKRGESGRCQKGPLSLCGGYGKWRG